jgi:phage terminase large subunit GpA-like protein
MEELLSQGSLDARIGAIVAGEFLAKSEDVMAMSAHYLRPPQRISTVECAEKYRYLRSSENSGKALWSRKRTPYNVGPMNALDNTKVNEVVLVKPSRSGGTVVGENYLFRSMIFGPSIDVCWYLNSDNAVRKYLTRIIKPMFEDHPDLQARVGFGRSDDNDSTKRINGRLIEWLAANDAGFRNREALFIAMDETDEWSREFAATPLVQAFNRQKNLGNRRKVFVASHPDLGWSSGIASAYQFTNHGIYIMQCEECESFAAAHATKFWPDVPEFKITYRKIGKDHSSDERVAMAKESAALSCPHCGCDLTDDQRYRMIDAEIWMHDGQSLDVKLGVIGEPSDNSSWGFWVHGSMIKTPLGDLTRQEESAIIKLEQTGQAKQLRQHTVKGLGEVFEADTTGRRNSSAMLQQRATTERMLHVGEFPADGKFITSAVDIGSGKFDVSFRAWDLEARSWWLDRLTLKQWVDAGGQFRDIRTRERIEDWDILFDQVINRKFPILGREGWAMVPAVVTIDIGDGNVTAMGREFAARAIRRGCFWGSQASPWSKVRLIQGSPNPKAPEVSDMIRKPGRDDENKIINPLVKEYTLGVHKLKELSVERLGISDSGPGQCYFAQGISQGFFDEYFNERLIEGKWQRNGPNESLDLFAYEEAGRLMLRPDRQDMWKNGALPPWARPVRLNPEGGELVDENDVSIPKLAEKPKSIFERFDALND